MGPVGSNSSPTGSTILWGGSISGNFMRGAEVGMWNSPVDRTPATQTLKFAVPTDPGFCSTRVATCCPLCSEPSQGLLTSNLPVIFLFFSLLPPPVVSPSSSFPSILPPQLQDKLQSSAWRPLFDTSIFGAPMAKWLRDYLSLGSRRPPPQPPTPDYTESDILRAYREQKDLDFEDPYEDLNGRPEPEITGSGDPKYNSPRHRLIKVEAADMARAKALLGSPGEEVRGGHGQALCPYHPGFPTSSPAPWGV